MKYLSFLLLAVLVCSCTSATSLRGASTPYVLNLTATVPLVPTNSLMLTETMSPTPTPANAMVQEFQPGDLVAYDDSMAGFPTTQFSNMAVGPDGVAWVLDSGGMSIVRITQNNWSIIEIPKYKYGEDSARSIAVAGIDDVWIGYQSGIISRYKGGVWIEFPTDKWVGLPIQKIVAQGNQVWAAAESVAILFTDGKPNGIFHPGTPSVADFAIAPDGRTWIALWDSLGLYNDGKWSTYKLTNFNCDHCVLNHVASAADNSVWFGAGYGLYHYHQDTQNWESYPRPNDLWFYDPFWFATGEIIISEDEVVWVNAANSATLYCFNGNWLAISELPYSSTDMAQAPDGSLWFATIRGIYHYLKPQCGN